MPIFDNDSNFPVPTWTKDDVVVLEAIDDYYALGIVRFLGFLISNEGIVADSTLDLILVVQSIVNDSDEKYSFDDAERIVTLSSEFCLVDCVYENQVLAMIELQDNAVLFLAIQGEDHYALEAAVCLAQDEKSLLFDGAVRPSLSLFGDWENIGAVVLESMLTRRLLSDSIGSLMDHTSNTGLWITSEVEFVDVIRKLCAVGLLSVDIVDTGRAMVTVQEKAAGLFLLFSGRTELAKELADLSI